MPHWPPVHQFLGDERPSQAPFLLLHFRMASFSLTCRSRLGPLPGLLKAKLCAIDLLGGAYD